MAGSEVLLTLLGAVALLLWGVRMVRTGLTRAFSGPLRALLARASQGRFHAFGAGLLVTLVLQSSTATSVLLSSFAGRGLIALPAALAVLLGAAVGSTIVVQAFSIDIRWLWSGFLFAGFVAFSASKGERARNGGRIAIGLGLMLLALTELATVSAALRDSPTAKLVLAALSSELAIAVLVAALLTWLAHSSLAIVLFIMSLAAGGTIELSVALALVLGANIGGAIAPYVALTGGPVTARRVPLGYLIAQAATAIILIPLVPRFANWIAGLSASDARNVLNFHMLFNMAVAAAFLTLLTPLSELLVRLLPAPVGVPDRRTPQHLDATVLDQPSEALGCALRETLSVGDIVLDMLRRSLTAIEGNDLRLVREIEKMDNDVDALHEAIKLYLIRTSKLDMTEDESRRYVEILTFITNLEHIGDIIDKNLMELAAKRIKKRFMFSAEGLAELKRFHGLVVDHMRLALNVFATRDVTLARRLLEAKTMMRAEELDAADRHFARLRDGRPESIETSSIHVDIIRDLKRINSHLTSVAYPILEVVGVLRESRLRAEVAPGNENPSAVASPTLADGQRKT